MQFSLKATQSALVLLHMYVQVLIIHGHGQVRKL